VGRLRGWWARGKLLCRWRVLAEGGVDKPARSSDATSSLFGRSDMGAAVLPALRIPCVSDGGNAAGLRGKRARIQEVRPKVECEERRNE